MIKINPAHKGLLKKTLGVSARNKIPMASLEKALHSPNPATRKRANFAINARGWNHKGT